MDPYEGREQSKAKHIILKNYLEALAFKILTFKDLVFVDGFSGPWESRAEDFSDTSFRIALDTLVQVQNQVEAHHGSRKVTCVFCENRYAAFQKLSEAVAPYHKPENNFHVHAYHGKFEDKIASIVALAERAFILTFVDPTGWTGYPYSKIAPILKGPNREVVINFMFDYANRFTQTSSPEINKTFNPILGGEGWDRQIDRSRNFGDEVVRLFRETLRREGQFRHVAVAPIDKTTMDRTQFVLAYGTNKYAGLVEFRNSQAKAMKINAQDRLRAKDSKKGDSRQESLFDDPKVLLSTSAKSEHERAFNVAKEFLIQRLSRVSAQSLPFEEIAAEIMEEFPLRETDVKQICIDLWQQGVLMNTWSPSGSRRRKPRDNDLVRLVADGSPAADKM